MTPQELKNSILQLAIQGKLVEQRPEEGTAEELYRQIQQEKQALIKAGKIKKEKLLPEITEDEIPFEIPESWKWVRFGDCTNYAQAKEKMSPIDLTDSIWSLDLEDIEKDTGKIINYNTAGTRKISGEKVVFKKGQILYSKLRPYLKKILIAPDDGICSPELVPFSVYGNLDTQYIVSVLKTPHIDFLINSVTYGVKMPRVGTDTMINLLIPLPPLAEQKRIVAKIEELLPYIDRYEKAWNRLEDFNKRFPADMKKSILQLAIQGKLVEQRPEEGTGEALYQQIQKEKQTLIKAGKIKKEKPLPEITEEEIPFEIPENWKWVKLKSIALKIVDGTHHSPPNNSDGDYMYVTAKNIKDCGVILDNITYVKKEVHDEIYARCNPEKDDILLIKDGATTGVVTVNNIQEPFSMLSSVALLKMLHCVDPWYLVFVMRSDLFYSNARKQMKGTGITRITLSQIEPMIIPLPPLAEQKRIVAKLEELLPLCERLK